MLNAFESLLGHLSLYRGERDRAQLLEALQRDNFSYVDGRIISGVALPEVHEESLRVDPTHLRASIDRIRDAVEQGRSLAIGSSKELVEATCKAIPSDAGEATPDNATVTQLVNTVAAVLDLLPANIAAARVGAASIRVSWAAWPTSSRVWLNSAIFSAPATAKRPGTPCCPPALLACAQERHPHYARSWWRLRPSVVAPNAGELTLFLRSVND